MPNGDERRDSPALADAAPDDDSTAGRVEGNATGRSTDASSREPTLAELVSSVTRRAPDSLLATAVIVGILGMGVVAIALPTWWRAISVFALLAAGGGWGIADRERAATGGRGTAFALVRAVSMLGSVVAAGFLVLMFLSVTLGTWIS